MNERVHQDYLRLQEAHKVVQINGPRVYCSVFPRPHPVAVIQGRCVSCGQPVRSVPPDAVTHHHLCASQPGPDPGPNNEGGTYDDRGRYRGPCDCGQPVKATT